MASLLPLKPTTTRDDREVEPRLVGVDDPEAEEVLSAISSATARRILDLVYEQPRPASELAEELDSSLQNVSYHLDRLEDAGILEVVEVWYSERGREMDVYAPGNSALVLYAGAEEAKPSLSDALHRALGAVGIVGLASALIHTHATAGQNTGSDVGIMGEQPARSDPTYWETIVEFATGPGGTAFAAGLLAIVLGFLAWYWVAYRGGDRSRAWQA
ncbi:helix-turn-helix domain-containing protein [Salinarchaeum chitinilyticum]